MSIPNIPKTYKLKTKQNEAEQQTKIGKVKQCIKFDQNVPVRFGKPRFSILPAMIVSVSWHIHDEYAMNVECELKVDKAEMEFAVF